ncbi:VWA domain-containing protein [Rhodobacteraceae bacterium HSP-20]|uniref:VWA domain-containing protein n=1 Tax=Paragemmobacter amnigenus TaxID=2852097 RepID=A0ABS6IY12_9RHOB|nr:VWA domain-containing protein [Rhodobacter amnigenus]MBU9696410.1 VWA domain-containing protein [Rhodobacter amnigenus]MBV4387637.1 VWA domain-containing protein [Rhodobacter amnigenus]
MPALELPEDGKLSHNIAHFARALRRAGLPIGPGRVIDAIRAVEAAGFSERADFFWTLHACFVSRPEQRAVFEQVFRLYWRDPQYLEHMMSLMLPAVRGVQEDRLADAAEKRAAEALLDGQGPDLPGRDGDGPQGEDQIEIDATATMSHEERLRTLDFEQMSLAEVAEAKRMLARLSLPVRPLLTRRMRADAGGARIDGRRTLRAALRQGGEVTELSRKSPGARWPNLVVLCDISGSMSQYSRLVLHFVHAVANRRGQGWAKVHAFTFGTRLTNITRHLKNRDVDAALKAAGAEAQDWSGGTRIGTCLRAFNRDWSRRVLGQGAVVLLITDGLDRDDTGALAAEMERLHLSSRRLIWLNPLLRWEGFAPRATGIRAMLPHVDSFRAGHSIASLEALGKAISESRDSGEKARLLAMIGA